MKALRTPFVCWCMLLSVHQNALAEEFVPVLPSLDKLHNENTVIPSVNEPYKSSEMNFTPADDGLSPSAFIYNNVNDGVEENTYYTLGFKRTIGEGDNVKYFKWYYNSSNTARYLVETANEFEADLTVRYNSGQDINKIIVEAGVTVDKVNADYTGQNISNAISTGGTIKSISSTFAGNTINASDHDYAYSAILTESNDGASIEDISASFIGNTINVDVNYMSYGTLIKSLSHIGNVVSEFAGNNVNLGTSLQGGFVAVKPFATIDYIQSDFINNAVIATSGKGLLNGGLIGVDPNSVLGEIDKSLFTGNISATAGGELEGGLIYNGGTITNGINNSVFNNNAARSTGADIKGGVIANKANMSINNSVFTGNTAQSDKGNAFGAVLYTDVNTTIAANDGKTTEFKDNQVKDKRSNDWTNEAIYVDDGRHTTLTLDAKEDGKIVFDKDYINGDKNYSVAITGDGTGTVSFINGGTIKGANVSAKNVNLNFIDDKYTTHNFSSLNSQDDVNYAIDLNFASRNSDKFVVGEASQGKIVLSDLKILGDPPKSTVALKILETTSNNIELMFANGLVDKYAKTSVISSRDVNDTNPWPYNAISWDKEFYTRHYETTRTEGVRLASSVADSINDSVEYFVNDVENEVSKTSMGDTLRLYVEGTIQSNHGFNAASADDVYTMTEDGGILVGSKSINGVASSGKYSTIDADGHVMPVVNSDSLSYYRVKIMNTKQEDGSVATIGENGSVVFDSSEIVAPGIAGIVNDGKLTIRYNSNIYTDIKGEGTLNFYGWVTNAYFKGNSSIIQKAINLSNHESVHLEDGIIQGDITIDPSGNYGLSVKAGNIIDPDGVDLKSGHLDLYAGTLTTDVNVTNGGVNIKDDVILDAIIKGGTISVDSSATLTSVADNIQAGINTTGGGVILTGGTFHANAGGGQYVNKTITIDGDVTLASDGKMRKAIVKDGSTFTVEAQTFGSDNYNDITAEENTTINLLGGERGYGNINSKGDVNIKDDLVLGGWFTTEIVAENLNIEENVSLTSRLDWIKGKNIILEEGATLKSTGGNLSNKYIDSLTGDGSIEFISDTSIFNANSIPLTIDSVVKSGATLDIIGDKYQHATTVEEGGTFILSTGTYTKPVYGKDGTVLLNRGYNYVVFEAPIYGNIVLSAINSIARLTISADNLNFANSITMDNSSMHLILKSGTLTKDFGFNAGTVYVDDNQDVTFKAPVKTTTNINSNANLHSKAEYLNDYVTINGNAHLYLGEKGVEEVLETTLPNSSDKGYLNIVGDITLSNYVNPIVVIEEDGVLHTTTDLFSNDRITNNGELYLSGNFGLYAQRLVGQGTTYVDGELGYVNQNNYVEGTLNFNDGVFNTKGTSGNNIRAGKVAGDGEWQFKLDWGNDYDKFTFAQDSDAVIKIDPNNLALLNLPTSETPVESSVKRILINDTDARLVLLDNKFSQNTMKSEIDDAKPDVYYNEEFNRKNTSGVITGDVVLPDKDSIQLTNVVTTWEDPVIERADLLVALKNLNTKEDRHFRFETANDRYNMIEDGSENYVNGKLFIDGVTSTDENGVVSRSIIDLNGNALKLSNEYLNIKNVEFENVDNLYLIGGNGVKAYYLDEDGNMQGGIENIKLSNTNIDGQYGILNFTGNSQLYQLSDSVFTDNNRTYTNESYTSSLSLTGGLLNIDGATVGAGGIRNVLFDNNNIVANVIEGSTQKMGIGGAIIRIDTNSNVSGIFDSVFSNNSAEAQGDVYGTIALYGQSVIDKIENVKFINNSVVSKTNGEARGGVMYIDSSTVNEIKDSTFENNSAKNGGAIYLNKSIINKITGSVFRNNNATTVNSGGAIYSPDSSNNANIGEISDSIFENNTANAYGGAICLNTSLNKLSNTQFIRNIATESGGAVSLANNNNSVAKQYSDLTFTENGIIAKSNNDRYGGGLNFNYNQTIDYLKDSIFTGNYIISEMSGENYGGALALTGNPTINEISNLTFKGNHIDGKSSSCGGAMHLSGPTVQTFQNITFEDNYINNTNSNDIWGGALYFGGGTVKKFDNVVFKNNYITGSYAVYGGAMSIDKRFNIPEISNSLFEGNHIKTSNMYSGGGALLLWEADISTPLVIKNSIFRDNYAQYSSIGNLGRGAGAISSGRHLVIAAEGTHVDETTGETVANLSEFTGNYITDGSKTKNEAIWMSNKNLTLISTDGGRILLNDSIRSGNNNVYLQGDEDSTISLYNNIDNSKVVFQGDVNIDTADSNFFDYNFNKLTSENTAKLTLDIDAFNGEADTFTVGKDSTGVVYIDKLNVISNPVTLAENEDSYIVQVLKSQNDNIQLELNENLTDTEGNALARAKNALRFISDKVTSKDVIHQEAGYGLASVVHANDGIEYFVEKDYDALSAIAAAVNNEERTFEFTEAGEVYNFGENFAGVTANGIEIEKGTLNINGIEAAVRNTIDFGTYEGDVFSNNGLYLGNKDITLNISNTEIKAKEDAYALKSTGSGTINLDNAKIDGNIWLSVNTKFNINGQGADLTNAIINTTDGGGRDAYITLNEGRLKFGTNTLTYIGASRDVMLNAYGGTIDFLNGEAETYTLGTYASHTDNVKLAIDVDFKSEKSDLMDVSGWNDLSTGTLQISEINFINSLTDDEKDFNVRVLKSQNDSIQLTLADELKYEKLKDLSRIEADEVLVNTNFNDTYYNHRRDGELARYIELASIARENDGLNIKVKGVWENSTVIDSILGDTLALINQADYAERQFTSNNAFDVYDVKGNLGKTADGDFTIQGTISGKEMSTINLNDYEGFTLSDNTELIINETRITSNNPDKAIINAQSSSAVVTLSNAEIDGKITGDEQFTINISGNGTSSISGEVENANVNLSKGVLEIAPETFASENTVLNLLAEGRLKMANSEIENYIINELHSTQTSHYSIDVNLSKAISDTITVGENSEGKIVLESFNVIGSLDGVGPGSDYTIKILNAENSNIQLELSESLLSALKDRILLGNEFVVDSIDTVKAVSQSSDLYWKHGHDEDVYGKLDLLDGETANDSLHLYEFAVEKGKYRDVLGDTLKLVVQLDENNRGFEFNKDYSNNEKYNKNAYTVIEDIGTVTAGSLNVAGVIDGGKLSILDFDKYLGFSLTNETEITISDVEVVNINNKNGSFATISNPNAVLNLNNVIIAETTSKNAIVNSGTLNMTGGNVNISTGIYGIGTTNITGGAIAEFVDGVNITQREVNVNDGSLILSDNSVINGLLDVKESGNIKMSAKALTSAVNNEGNINLTGGNLEYNITGEGKTKVTGDVVNNAKVDNSVDIQAASFKSVLDKLGGAINNAGKFITSGVLDKNITGKGETVLDGDLTIKPNSDIEGILSLNDKKVNVADSKVNNYNIGEINGNGTLSLDMDFGAKTSDKFITSNTSDGNICINSINFKNLSDMEPSTKIQVLDTNGGSALQLSLASEISGVNYNMGRTARDEIDEIVAKVNYTDLFHTYVRGGDVYGNLTLGQTSTLNDSVVVTINKDATVWDDDRTISGNRKNIMVLWNTLDTEDDKQFTFNNSSETVSLKDTDVTGMGEVKGINQTIKGVSTSETVKSTIDFASKSGFEINDAVNFKLSDVKLTGAENLITVNKEGTEIGLQDTYIDGNIQASENYNLNISGNDVTTLNGIVNNVKAKLESGILKFNTDTFKDSETTLNVEGGTVSLLDNSINNYVINDLTSSKDASWSIDIDLTNKTADTITTTADGNGFVKLGNVCITGSVENPDSEYKVQVLKTGSDNLQLDLSDELKAQLQQESYLLGTRTIKTVDVIEEYTNWKDKFNQYSQKEYTYGSLQLAKTDTENDSIGIKIKELTYDPIVNEGSIGDALAIVNRSEDYAEKYFVFDNEENVYKVEQNLGEIKGTVNIEGIKKNGTTSGIDLNSNSGFEVGSGNKLVINNTELFNGNAEEGSVINAQEGAEIILTNSSIINNSSTDTKGAAISSKSDVVINADDYRVVIQGNYTSTSNEAIYMGENATLSFNSKNNSQIDIDDKINGDIGYKTVFDGDESGRINLNNELKNSGVELNNVTLHLSGNDNFKTSDFTVNSGVLDLINDTVQNQTAQSFNVLGSFKLNVDANLASETMDRLPENTTIAPDAFINVDRINLLSDASGNKVEIPFAYNAFKDNVNYIGAKELSKSTQVTTAYAPIYKYSLKYENRDDLGYFVFNKGAGESLSSYRAFNPAILASSVASQAGGYATMNETFNYVFEHSDEFSTLPDCCRQYVRGNNNQALADCVKRYNCYKYKSGAEWFRPYVNFEKIGLHNGPEVTVTSYGSLAGADSEYKELKNGWGTVSTFYVGYNGSNQSYSGVKTYQNGGLLGLTQTFYKDNFFTALTASVGASVGESSTMYGNENFTMLMSGIASKSGYNFAFKEGRYILQPQLFMSYTFINTFDYTNAAGVKIDSAPLNTIQVHPALKFAGNFESGWHPYISGGVVLNLLNQTNVTANGTKIPEISMKPYAEYGVGLMKQWGDSLTGDLSVMLRNGGRNGVALTMNFRYVLGDGNINFETIKNIKNFVNEHFQFSLKNKQEFLNIEGK